MAAPARPSPGGSSVHEKNQCPDHDANVDEVEAERVPELERKWHSPSRPHVDVAVRIGAERARILCREGAATQIAFHTTPLCPKGVQERSRLQLDDPQSDRQYQDKGRDPAVAAADDEPERHQEEPERLEPEPDDRAHVAGESGIGDVGPARGSARRNGLVVAACTRGVCQSTTPLIVCGVFQTTRRPSTARLRTACGVRRSRRSKLWRTFQIMIQRG